MISVDFFYLTSLKLDTMWCLVSFCSGHLLFAILSWFSYQKNVYFYCSLITFLHNSTFRLNIRSTVLFCLLLMYSKMHFQDVNKKHFVVMWGQIGRFFGKLCFSFWQVTVHKVCKLHNVRSSLVSPSVKHRHSNIHDTEDWQVGSGKSSGGNWSGCSHQGVQHLLSIAEVIIPIAGTVKWDSSEAAVQWCMSSWTI